MAFLRDPQISNCLRSEWTRVIDVILGGRIFSPDKVEYSRSSGRYKANALDSLGAGHGQNRTRKLV